MTIHINWRSILASVHPARAAAESLLLGCLLVFGDFSEQAYSAYLAGCILFFAFRMRIHENLLWRVRLLDDLRWGLPLAGVITLLLGVIFKSDHAVLSGQMTVGVLAFGGGRLLKYGWRWWDYIRRQYVVYELTHWFIMFVLLAGMLAVAGISIATNAIGEESSVPAIIKRLGEIIIISDGLLIVLLMMLFFPLTLFPYFISRRFTSRIKNLAEATSALRGGNYHVRAEVRGEDEVARLQQDFNAMAAELEQTLNALQTERNTVAELLRSRRELFASVSHELRTPVSTLKGYLESSLAYGDAAESPTLQTDFEIMQREVLHLERLISDLFTLARADVDQLELTMQAVDVVGVIKNIAETAAPLVWVKSKIEVIADLPQSLPLIHIDQNRLGQILDNLLYNAVRHTPPGGAVILAAQPEGDSILIQVRDTGEGIPADELPRIWERFYRTASAREKTRGTGLGLALVKDLTEAMGGQVSVESEPGEGSCFVLRFPVLPG